MSAVYVYPGSFCPPTFGHLAIVRKAAAVLPQLTIICSQNPEKSNNWFSPAECQKLWQSYDLPANVRVETFGQTNHDLSQIIMIRGIRDRSDLLYEAGVIALNSREFGIDKYLFITSDPQYQDISSSRARQLAGALTLEDLSRLVSPLIISALLEKTLGIDNLFLVVGPPGTGKSTLLQILCRQSDHNVHINTDDFNHQLRPLLDRHFAGQDLMKIALEQEDKLKDLVQKPWLGLLQKALVSAPKNSNLFVEIAYALQPDKMLWRYLGGKMIYVGCSDKSQVEQRLKQRGNPQLAAFAAKIPDYQETLALAKQYCLRLEVIDTSGSLDDLKEKTIKLQQKLEQGG